MSNLFGESVGHGMWTRLGPRKFSFTFKKLLLDPATAAYIGKTVVTDEIELNGAHREYTGLGYGVDYDPAGTVLNRYCRRTRGRAHASGGFSVRLPLTYGRNVFPQSIAVGLGRPPSSVLLAVIGEKEEGREAP
jgi:hypothetical protein